MSAFVPEPIPRKLPLDLPVVRLLAEAQHRLGRLSATTGRLVNPWLLAAPLLRQEAILSSRIEGTITSPEQLALFEAGGVDAVLPEEGQPEDTREVGDFVRATQYALEQLDRFPVSIRLPLTRYVRPRSCWLLGSDGMHGFRRHDPRRSYSNSWIRSSRLRRLRLRARPIC